LLDTENLNHLPDPERVEEERRREVVWREIEGLREQADYIEGDNAELPAVDELDDYDAELRARLADVS
jgi:hypothetical protein